MRRPRLLHTTQLVAASLIAAFVTVPVRAQSSSPTEALLNDRFVVSLGVFAVTSNLNTGLAGTANRNDQRIDFDKEFGTDAEQTRWRADALWRITARQHLRFSYFNNDVRHTRTIDRDLPWGDYTFLLGGQVTAESKFRVYELAYEFAFLRRADYEIVAIAGIHFEDLTLKLSGNASLTVDTPMGPVEEAATFTTKTNSVPAPLPVLGLRGEWAVSRHVFLEAAGELFALNYQGINGNWSDLRAGATWMFSDHFGVGLGYDHFATHADVDKRGFNGRLNLGYQGLLVYLKGGF